MKPRELAYDILFKADKNPEKLQNYLSQGLDNNDINHRDRRLVHEMVYGVIRRKLTLDYVINSLLNSDRMKENYYLSMLLRLGAYQILFMDRIPDHAAVNESVILAKKDANTIPLAGTVNAVLRNIIKQKNKLLAIPSEFDLKKRLSLEYSHPEWLVERWLSRFGLAKTKSILTFFNEKPKTYLRRRVKGLNNRQFEMETRKICESAGGTGYLSLYYQLNPGIIPESVFLLQEGECTVQAPSSGWIVASLDIKPYDNVLDTCSAPGGKTSLIAELCASGGSVLACESNTKRIAQLRENIDRMSLRNVHIIAGDASLPPTHAEFNKVLVDAPCSGTGIMHRHPEARWTKTLGDIERLIGVQKRILKGTSSLVAPGGVMLYSTCSLEAEENELQVERFLSENKNFVHEKNIPNVPQAFIDNFGYIRITPFEHKMDGMFGALLRRKY